MIAAAIVGVVVVVVEVTVVAGGRLLLVGRGDREWQEMPKEKVLHDRQLLEDLALVHLEHAFVHLAPRLDTGNVIQHRRVPLERLGLDLREGM